MAYNQHCFHGERTRGHLQGRPVRPNYPLSALDKPLLVPHQPTDLDHITRDIILQHLEGLTSGPLNETNQPRPLT